MPGPVTGLDYASTNLVFATGFLFAAPATKAASGSGSCTNANPGVPTLKYVFCYIDSATDLWFTSVHPRMNSRVNVIRNFITSFAS